MLSALKNLPRNNTPNILSSKRKQIFLLFLPGRAINHDMLVCFCLAQLRVGGWRIDIQYSSLRNPWNWKSFPLEGKLGVCVSPPLLVVRLGLVTLHKLPKGGLPWALFVSAWVMTFKSCRCKREPDPSDNKTLIKEGLHAHWLLTPSHGDQDAHLTLQSRKGESEKDVTKGG